MSSSPQKEKTQLPPNLSEWMTNLPQRIRDESLIRLAIPGSHDSMTYAITSKSRISPDAEPAIKRLRILNPLLEIVMAKWSRTQQHNAALQLNNGIRYFDLRISTKTGSDDLFFVHGQFGDNVLIALNDINDYLNEHLGEVVLLDCQHFYAFGPSDHEKFMNLLTDTFRGKLLPYGKSLDHVTLNYMARYKYQVIIIYRSDAARFGQPLLWPSAYWPNPWPNTVSISKLISNLDDSISHRDFKYGFISQCILTPTTFFVIKNIFSSLRAQCAVPLSKQKLQWIDKQRPDDGGLNIVIADFVELADCEFARAVIQLNEKYLL